MNAVQHTNAADSTPVSRQLEVGPRAEPSLGTAQLRVGTQILKDVMQSGNDDKMIRQCLVTVLITQLLVHDQHLGVVWQKPDV